MWAAFAALIAAAATPAAPPPPPAHDARTVVALLPLRALGVPADVVHALEVTLRNELSALPEAKLAPEKDVADALQREPDCEARVACAAPAASHAGARLVTMGTASQ